MDKITVPNPEDGLSDNQRDRLQVDMANSINHIVKSVDETNGKVKILTREIYGEDEYQGIKSIATEAKKESHKNSRWMIWLIRSLIVTGILAGVGIGIPQVVGS